MYIRSFYILLFLLAAALLGCTPSADEINDATQNEANGNDADNGDNTNQPVFIGADTETIDGIIYIVYSSAELYNDNPYIYTYYKSYILNNICRRSYTYDCAEYDYPYTEWAAHSDKDRLSYNVVIFSENGDISMTASYSNGILNNETFLSDGKTRFHVSYNNDGSLQSMTFYYVSGYIKYMYSNGFFYTFDDGKAGTSFSLTPSVYTSKEFLTAEQLSAKFEELRNML